MTKAKLHYVNGSHWCVLKGPVSVMTELNKKVSEDTAVSVLFLCSAFICLQINIVTKLGVELDLQITQHLLYCWHLTLKAPDFLLLCLLVTEHAKPNYERDQELTTEDEGQQDQRHFKYTYIHIYTNTYLYMYTTYIHVHKQSLIYTHICMYTFTHIYIYINSLQ